MRGFIITLLTCSIMMAVIALFYMAAAPLLTKRYSARGRYYAWLVVIIGLIIPFRPQWDNAIFKVNVPNVTDIETQPIVHIDNTNPAFRPETNMPTAHLTSAPSISLWQIMAAVWFGGMFAAIAYHTIQHHRFMKTACRWGENVTDELALAAFQNLKSEMGIPRQIGLYLCSIVDSPMLVGFIKPRVLLPPIDLSQDELRFILKHELVHYKRRDLYYKCAVLLATCIHWFNPIVYMIARAIDIDCEVSCDDEIVSSTGIETRRHYSETIIGVAKVQSKLKTALSTSFFGGKNGMRKRIFSIMDSGRKKAGIAVIFAALVMTMGTGSVFAANTAAESQQSSAVVSESDVLKIRNYMQQSDKILEAMDMWFTYDMGNAIAPVWDFNSIAAADEFNSQVNPNEQAYKIRFMTVDGKQKGYMIFCYGEGEYGPYVGRILIQTDNTSTDFGETNYESPNAGTGYPPNHKSADDEAITRMELSGTWGDEISVLFPDMSPDAVYTVVGIYLDRHLFSGKTTAEAARRIAETIEPALRYMTEEAKKSVLSRVEAFY